VLKQLRPPHRLLVILEGESLFNDASALLIYRFAVGAAIAGVLSPAEAIPTFFIVTLGSVVLGYVLARMVIGLTSIGGTNHVSTRMTLRQFGLDIDKDVKILAIGEEKLMVDTFKMGRVDAIVVAPPFSVQLKREGFPILAQTADHVVIPFSGLGTTLDRIKNNRAQIKRVLRAEIEALRFIQNNAAGTTEVIRKRFNMDEKLARESYDAVVNSFSRDGRVPLDGVDILLQIEKDAKVIPATVTSQMIVEPSLAEEALKELGGK
jgi:ABC-type nitrate/sulfonate/bicarbonate transport system substrate-binding protein